MIVAGIECLETIHLNKQIKICSLDDLTWSFQKECLLRSIDPSENPFLGIQSASGLVPNGFNIQSMKRCAIVYERPQHPTIPLEQSINLKFYAEDLQTFHDLVSFVKFFATFESAAPYIEANWQQTNEDNLNRWRLNWGTVGDNFQFKQFIPKRLFGQFKLDTNLTGDLYKKIQALDAKLKQKLLLALDHILIARYHQYEDEQILNTAIALEAILLGRDADRDGKSEKFALRAALILEETKEAREITQKDFKKFYGYRSDLVHSGELKRKADGSYKIEAKILETVIDNTGKIIQKIIENNKIPNWKDLELSHQSIWE